MRILVIEDDPAMAETLVTIFERQGFQVDAVDTAEEGLIRTSATRYALLLLDLLLPGMRGDELLHRLRARGARDEGKMPSGRGGRLSRQALRPAGADGAHPGDPATRARS